MRTCKGCESRRIECHINCPIYEEQVREYERRRKMRHIESEATYGVFRVHEKWHKVRGRKKQQ